MNENNITVEEKELKLLIEKSQNNILKWEKLYEWSEYFAILPDKSKYCFQKGVNVRSQTTDYTLRFFDKEGNFINEIYAQAISKKNIFYDKNDGEDILFTLSVELYNVIIKVK